ncbi:hypothetical protein AKJ09_10988 [Labilithrix luteola]|uniref:TonB C-terminal domain-containing protein n=1 Tax=Labilithrix luteola TaxID=1391654 RepID=A0A0K1QFX9_9BACT|nr:hypothetical protein [Labilithrix luteola]AKV04325.1 hypothetical protein AKJ09_10988 [Labilithrix luteola]
MRFRESLLLVGLVCCGPTRARVESPMEPGAKAYEAAKASEARGFDRGSAATALAVDVQPCKTSGVPTGVGHVSVMFGADGTVVDARLDETTLDGKLNPFIGTAAAPCILERFKASRIKPFAEGPPVTVGRSFTIR